jgi:hypothetical protein
MRQLRTLASRKIFFAASVPCLARICAEFSRASRPVSTMGKSNIMFAISEQGGRDSHPDAPFSCTPDSWVNPRKDTARRQEDFKLDYHL